MRTRTVGPATVLAALSAVLVLTTATATATAAEHSPDLTTAASTAPGGGRLLAFTGWLEDDHEQSLLTIDTTTRQVHPVARGGGVGALTWSADGRRLVWIGYDGHQDGSSTLYSARPDGSERRTLMSGHDIRSIAAAPDGTLAIARAGIPTSIDCATHPP
ncbi:hypothetical protein GTQ99_23745, partial [Kineococcus sp. T13]|uniref:hypothetical protein n=1 Tax=Kineococcus vitellinus TaxID=2696565 RepID=UPI001411BB5A